MASGPSGPPWAPARCGSTRNAVYACPPAARGSDLGCVCVTPRLQTLPRAARTRTRTPVTVWKPHKGWVGGRTPAASGRHWEPATPDPASEAILATKRHFKGRHGTSSTAFCTEFQAGASQIRPGGWGATFFSTFFEGGMSKILGGGLSGGKKWENPT